MRGKEKLCDVDADLYCNGTGREDVQRNDGIHSEDGELDSCSRFPVVGS